MPLAITGGVICWNLRAKKRTAAASAGERVGSSQVSASRRKSNTPTSAARLSARARVTAHSM